MQDHIAVPPAHPTKACPVVLRRASILEVLGFEHPLAGLQLVKGTIEPGETEAQAAVRELEEESGLRSTVKADLGCWESGFMGQVWSFQLVRPLELLPDTWIHHADDDGGHQFRFFWYPLSAKPTEQWHPVFRRALGYLECVLSEPRFAVDADVS